ncbi:MAG: GNAT family N-acetyltransferase [Candidatus Cloacimonetes bacterium]|nr:GNAT family N-acetyltransferase [Candidatus Cloacimonadota bacterium]
MKAIVPFLEINKMNINNIQFQVIEFRSAEYRQAVYLRYKILRQPLGLHFTKEQLEEENGYIHITGEFEGKIIAYLYLIPIPENRYCMRQVAVQEDFQGLGIGRKLVEFSELIIKERHAAEMFMHARLTAIPFYEKLGYVKSGELFSAVGLPHFEMRKYFTEKE